MGLAGQDSRADQRGYAMAALLVGMSVMAVMMAAALPVWSHAARREKEEELIWRGEQYKRAIMLFQRKYANTFPPSLDILVEQRFLRKKYKDPITNDDFQIIPVGAAQPGMPGGFGGVPNTGPGSGGCGSPQPGMPGGGGAFGGGSAGMTASGGLGSLGGGQPGGGFGAPGSQPGGGFGNASGFGGAQQSPPGSTGGFAQMTPGTQPAMGIQGVTSKSKESSIKLYNGMDRYNQWAFVYLAATAQAGAGGANFARPGQGAAGGAARPGQTGNPGGFGAPGSFGTPTMPPVPGGGFGNPGGFGAPAQPGGFGQPMQPGAPPGGGSIFTPVAPPQPGQPSPPPFGNPQRPPGR